MIPGALLLADSDTDKGSPIGLFVLLILVVAVYFLWRSMNRHLKKVEKPAEENFEAQFQPERPAAAAPETTTGRTENDEQPPG